MTTGFYWDESCFWHGGGNYAFMAPVGGIVQPGADLPENPETKRRLKNLMDVTGLLAELETSSAPDITHEDLLRVHPASFLDQFKALSDAGGGELGLRAPFSAGGYEIASKSAGLTKAALFAVLEGRQQNAYALSRPPGHHCMPEWQNGFCLLANIAIAVEAAFAAKKASRIAVLDWDVHHGNGTEAIFYDRDDVLTISIHQENNYPLDTGDFKDRGTGKGEGYNLNIPLPPGAGHREYLMTMERLVCPALHAYQPDAIVVACGFDAAAFDPLGRMMCSADTFGQMTAMLMETAADVCEGRIAMAHEGGYSEVYVPFCGHATIARMAGSKIHAADPFAATLEKRQPGDAYRRFFEGVIGDMTGAL